MTETTDEFKDLVRMDMQVLEKALATKRLIGSLKNAISQAGGAQSLGTIAFLTSITAFDLITMLSTNNVEFVYNRPCPK